MARGHSALITALALVVALAALLAGCAGASGRTATQGNVSGAATQPTASPYALTYVAIGASDAFGVGTDDPTQDNWPNVLAGELGHLRAQVHLIDLGIPGSTVADAQDEELPVALAAQPDIVTVWLAVNDVADNVPLATYTSELNALLAALRTQTHARVYVGNLPDLTLLPYFANHDTATLRATVADWNAEIARVCAANGATLVDLHAYGDALSQHPEYLAPDGLHPSTQGAQALAGVFALAIHG
ncbi:MAG: SGNH/GDSL hydrolase family protein [Ktedonobacterales bacterium]